MSPKSKSIIVTGANSGLGLEIALQLARDPARMVVVACRSPQSGCEAVASIEAQGGKAAFLRLDLGDQRSVRDFVEQFRRLSLPPLHGIVCNAGMQNIGEPQPTAEGYETTFAVNHLGHYLLTRLLLDDLAADGRITFVASGVHDPKQRTGMPAPVYVSAYAVAHDMESNRNAGLRRYSTSKLCNVMCAYEFSRHLQSSDDPRLQSIKVNSVDPGFMPATALARSWPPHLQWVSRHVLPLLRFFVANIHPPHVSGARIVALTTGPEAAPGGRYFSNGAAVRSSDASYDPMLRQELWVSSAQMTGLSPELVQA
jgi:NAD(P)-dependent dehydrogenase (short-subunit alcohol dehydrogenase family)